MLDAHRHFWKVDRGDTFERRWISSRYREFGPGDLSPVLDRAGITRTVLMQAAETKAERDFHSRISSRRHQQLP